MRLLTVGFILILFLFNTISGIAQEIQIDTSSVLELRIPDEEVIEAYANDPDFIYQEIPENPNSLSQRLFGFILNIIFQILANPFGEFLIYFVLIASVIGLVVALINQLMGGELVTLFKSDKNKGFSLGINKEELENTDFEQLLSEAIQQSDYHAATRYAYLIALQILANKGLINWSIEKTNLDFIHELTGHPLKDDFTILTNTYEYVEYGDFEINASQFQRYRSIFDKIKSSLND